MQGMVEEPRKRKVPPWLYKLFTGHQYPYVRRLAKFEKKDRKTSGASTDPTLEEIDVKFWEVYLRCSARILQEVKNGMIVSFSDLGTYPAGGYQELVDEPEAFLAREFGICPLLPWVS